MQIIITIRTPSYELHLLTLPCLKSFSFINFGFSPSAPPPPFLLTYAERERLFYVTPLCILPTFNPFSPHLVAYPISLPFFHSCEILILRFLKLQRFYVFLKQNLRFYLRKLSDLYGNSQFFVSHLLPSTSKQI